jgi:hypothetical protein
VIIKRIEEAMAFVRKVASGPTRAHAAHQALLRIWATGGLAAADEAMWDIALPLFESEDTKLAIPGAVQALAEGKPRPQFRFKPIDSPRRSKDECVSARFATPIRMR